MNPIWLAALTVRHIEDLKRLRQVDGRAGSRGGSGARSMGARVLARLAASLDPELGRRMAADRAVAAGAVR